MTIKKFKQDAHINPLNRQAIRDAIIKDITQGSARFNCAVTLTFPCQPYNRTYAQKDLLYFRDKYNKMLGYKENHRRAAKYNKQLSAPFAAFIEGDGKNVNFHYHLALHKPDAFSIEHFAMKINLLWQAVTHRTNVHTDCQAIYSDGWAEYITKQLGTCNADACDELNYNVY